MKKVKGFICDIDGTVANHDGIRGHYEYDKVSLDIPHKYVIDVVRLLAVDLQPVFLSGRPERARKDTHNWIIKHIDPFGDFFDIRYQLCMRPDFLPDGKPDYRQDYVVKEEIYHNKIAPYVDIQFAIDDRPQVLKLWHRLGIPTLAVGTPWVEF
jgi:hypothetical protein